MLRTDPSEQPAGAAGTALVPMSPILHWAPKIALPRPDPSFVTQMIASAEHMPQAARLRRAAPSDAQIAYGNKRPLPSVTARTRQVA